MMEDDKHFNQSYFEDSSRNVWIKTDWVKMPWTNLKKSNVYECLMLYFEQFLVTTRLIYNDVKTISCYN